MKDTSPVTVTRTWEVALYGSYGEGPSASVYLGRRTVTLSGGRDAKGRALPIRAQVDGQEVSEETAVRLLNWAKREGRVTLLSEERTVPTIGKARASELHRLMGRAGIPSGTTRLALFEFRVDHLHNSMLDRMAEYHYVYPAAEPADIEVEGFIHPSDLGGRVEVGTYARAVEVWEYRLTDDRGLTMGVLTGQADDPYKLAQALLLKRQSTNAVITAVTALG